MEELDKATLTAEKEKINAFSVDTFTEENEDLQHFNERFSKIVEKLERENEQTILSEQQDQAFYYKSVEKNELPNTQRNNIGECVPNVLQTPNYDYISTVESVKKNKIKTKSRQKKRFRLKLVCVLYAVTFVLVGGWVIGNAISISNTTNAINSTRYEINEIQLIIKEAQLDSFQDVQNGEESLITSIVNIEASKLMHPTEVQPQTNIFDKICNWFQSIFAGK